MPHGDPVTMTQALMDSLAAQVRERPGQWFWVHRRWKPARQARARGAALIGENPRDAVIAAARRVTAVEKPRILRFKGSYSPTS